MVSLDPREKLKVLMVVYNPMHDLFLYLSCSLTHDIKDIAVHFLLRKPSISLLPHVFALALLFSWNDFPHGICMPYAYPLSLSQDVRSSQKAN